MSTFAKLNNVSTKKVGSFQGLAGQWITAYELNGEFFTEQRGFVMPAKKDQVLQSVQDQKENDAKRKSWLLSR